MSIKRGVLVGLKQSPHFWIRRVFGPLDGAVALDLDHHAAIIICGKFVPHHFFPVFEMIFRVVFAVKTADHDTLRIDQDNGGHGVAQAAHGAGRP